MACYLLVIIVVLLDQATKLFALKNLSLEHSVQVIPQILDLSLVMNNGVAFGLFSGHKEILFGAITLSLLFLLLFLIYISKKKSTGNTSLDMFAYSLIIAGAVGNWIDRLRFSAVVDFIDFKVWPVFNVADIAISVGVGLYFIYAFKRKDN